MNGTNKTLQIILRVLGWAATAVCVVFALVQLPSFASAVLLLAAICFLPLAPVKAILAGAKISRRKAAVLGVVLFLAAAILAAPSGNGAQPGKDAEPQPTEAAQSRSMPGEPDEPEAPADDLAEAAAGGAALSLIEATPEPTPEAAPDPTKDPAIHTYILNTSTRRFHYPSCASVGDIKDSNRQDYEGTREDVIAMGYEPCGRCHP